MARTASPLVRQRWQQLLDGFDSGFETVAQFCERNHVSTTSFYKWKRKLADAQASRDESSLASASAFLPVQLNGQLSASSAVSVRHGELCIDVPVDQKLLLFELIDHLRVDSLERRTP